jgi:hypothetical protein
MNYYNYSVSTAKGALYLKSKTPLEGYEEVTYGTENKKTYHKYVKNVEGTLKYLDVKELDYEGKKLQFLEVTFIDGENSHKISAPLKSAKGNYSDVVRALVSSLDKAEVGEEYIINPYTKKSTGGNGKEYNNIQIYLNYKNRKNEEGKNLSTGFIPFDEIPKPEKDEDEDLGTTYDFKPVNKFYAQKIKTLKEKFATTAPTPSPAQPTAKEEPNDSLPF